MKKKIIKALRREVEDLLKQEWHAWASESHLKTKRQYRE